MWAHPLGVGLQHSIHCFATRSTQACATPTRNATGQHHYTHSINCTRAYVSGDTFSQRLLAQPCPRRYCEEQKAALRIDAGRFTLLRGHTYRALEHLAQCRPRVAACEHARGVHDVNRCRSHLRSEADRQPRVVVIHTLRCSLIYLALCLASSLPFALSIARSLYLSLSIYIYIYVYLSPYLYFFLYVYLSISISLSLSMYVYIYSSLSLSLSLSRGRILPLVSVSSSFSPIPGHAASLSNSLSARNVSL